MFSNFFIFFENCAVYETVWEIIVERGGPRVTIRRMLVACWVPKAANTHSEYVIPIVFPLQEWLHERASLLLLYAHCLSCYFIIMASFPIQCLLYYSYLFQVSSHSTFERVEEFKYLGTTLTNQNAIQEEIKSRLRSGNACYYLVQNLLSSRLLSKNLKIKIYRTIILLVVCMGVKLGS